MIFLFTAHAIYYHAIKACSFTSTACKTHSPRIWLYQADMSLSLQFATIPRAVLGAGTHVFHPKSEEDITAAYGTCWGTCASDEMTIMVYSRSPLTRPAELRQRLRRRLRRRHTSRARASCKRSGSLHHFASLRAK